MDWRVTGQRYDNLGRLPARKPKVAFYIEDNRHLQGVVVKVRRGQGING